jgi:DNA-binding NarL/FixJ family response regulator
MMTPKKTKVLLADDHKLFCNGLRELISHWQEFQVVGEARTGQEAIELCRQLLPDIVLMDIQMPKMNGIEATQVIRAEFPSIQVVMLTMSIEEDDLFEALKQGARGYLLKNISASELRKQLHKAVRGEAALTGAVAAKILAEFNQPRTREADRLIDPLTESQITILKLVAEGKSNKEIGEDLFLSEQTIKKQLSNIMQKLQLNNRVQAAVYAVQKGLTD